MKAMASVEEDKTMITERIKEEVGISSYNEQVRQFLEQQYKFVALRLRGRQANRSGGTNYGHTGPGSSTAERPAGGDSSGGDFAEVLKHLRRLDLRLECIEEKQDETKTQEEVARKQEGVARKLEEVARKLEEVTSKLGAVEKNQHGMMARERPPQ
jgi:hypothetical protein